MNQDKICQRAVFLVWSERAAGDFKGRGLSELVWAFCTRPTKNGGAGPRCVTHFGGGCRDV